MPPRSSPCHDASRPQHLPEQSTRTCLSCPDIVFCRPSSLLPVSRFITNSERELRPNPTEPGERQNSHTDPATIGPHQQFRGSTILLYGENTEKGGWQANVAIPEGKEVWEVDYRVVAPGLIDSALSPRERIPSTQQGRECPPEAAVPAPPVSRSRALLYLVEPSADTISRMCFQR